MKQIVLCALLLILAGGLFAGMFKPHKKADANRPAWVNDPYLEYPKDSFLCCVGTAKDRAEAENLAVTGLRKIFCPEPGITPETELRYYDLTRPAKLNPRTTMTPAELKQLTESELHLIRLGKVWTDKGGTVHVLAYLDRKATADVYLSALNQDKQRVLDYLTKALDITDPWQYYACLEAAMTIDQMILTRIAQLSIIDLNSGVNFNPGYDSEVLITQHRTAARQVRLNLLISSDQDAYLEDIIHQTITGLGFTFASSDASLLEASLIVESLATDKPRTDLRFTLQLSLFDFAQELVWNLEFEDTISEQDRTEAFARVKRAVNAKVAYELTGAVNRYTDSLIRRL